MVNEREAPGNVGSNPAPVVQNPQGGTENGPGASGQATGAGPTNPATGWTAGSQAKPVAVPTVEGGRTSGGPQEGGKPMTGSRDGNFTGGADFSTNM